MKGHTLVNIITKALLVNELNLSYLENLESREEEEELIYLAKVKEKELGNYNIEIEIKVEEEGYRLSYYIEEEEEVVDEDFVEFKTILRKHIVARKSEVAKNYIESYGMKPNADNGL